MKYYLFILVVATFFGCKKDSVAPLDNSVKIIRLNDTSEVWVGQTVGIGTGELVFRFDSLIQEARCPIGLECFWQGHASIHLTFPYGVDTLDTYFKQVITYGNYRIILIDLLPYPVWQHAIDKNAYIAKVKVTL
jgi:hypothetical protein